MEVITLQMPPTVSLDTAEPTKRTKRSSKKRGPDRAVYEEVNVLVTGFGTWDGFTSNPAWLIAKALPPCLSTSAAHPSRIRITVHPDPVPVTYEASAHLLSKIFSPSVVQMYHVILHLGVAPDMQGYKIERCARGGGYAHEDNSGKLPETVTEPDYWKEFLPMLATTASLEDVLMRWQSDFPDEFLRISDDAGHFLCEYLFYSSMAYMKTLGNQDFSWEERTTVEFLHVPPTTDEASITKGAEITASLLYAIVDSRRQRDGDFDGEESYIIKN